MTRAPPVFVHATAVVIGEWGVLIRGQSGSGKSRLALVLIADARRSGHFASLVGDDRIGLEARGDRIVACPHPAIAGQIEVLGRGLCAIEHEPACVLRLVTDLVARTSDLGPRCPATPPSVTLLGIQLPVLPMLANDAARDQSERILELVVALRKAARACRP